MNDFDFDVMRKKSLVASARKRVNGSKSKKCTLPYEYLTPAQRRELNGKVETMNVNLPITWGELKALPPHMAKEYIETLHRWWMEDGVLPGQLSFDDMQTEDDELAEWAF